MTIDHPVRRLLARVCSADTMARVVDPTLADVRYEDGHPTWRGYLVLLRALSVHAVMSVPDRLSRLYTEDGHVIPRVAVFSLGAALLGAVALTLPPLTQDVRLGAPSRMWLGLLLLPQGLALTMPAALLIAIPLATHRRAATARLLRRVILFSALMAAMTFGVIGWGVPAANQAFRVASSGKSEIPRGVNETSLAYLRSEIKRVRGFRGSDTLVRSMEYGYELRLALSTAAVPLGLLALASAFSPLGRRRPLAIGAIALVVYGLTLYPVQGLVVPFFLRRTSVPVASLAWVPNAVCILVAGILTARSRSGAVSA